VCQRVGGGARGLCRGAWGSRRRFRQSGKSARTREGDGARGRRSACTAALIHSSKRGWCVSRRAWSGAGGRPGQSCAQSRQIWRDLSSHRWGQTGYHSTGEGWLSTENREKSWLPRVRSKRGSVLRTNPRHGRPAIRRGKVNNFERINLDVHGSLLVLQTFHAWVSHKRDQYAPGWIFHLRIGRQVSRQQGPKPQLPCNEESLKMCRLLRISTHDDRVSHIMASI
jgi:hypothetical protein